MLQLISIPGGILVLASFFLGFFIKDVAMSSAYQDAYGRAFTGMVDTITTTTEDASNAAFQANTAKQNALELEKELARILHEAQTSELLTSTERQIEEIANNLMKRSDFIKQVSPMQKFKDFNRKSMIKRVNVNGGGSWGSWERPSYCPENYFVCGLRQRVERSQGKGDDTALNDIALECCPLFGESSQKITVLGKNTKEMVQ